MIVHSVWTKRLWLLLLATVAAMVADVATLSGPNVCMVKQKYNITKRIKYRAPMSVRTYEWCFSMPPRCSRWNTEMRDLTKLETEERTAEVSVCCPGYKMKDVSCVPICPNGKTGRGCSEDCQPNRWGPNCVHECKDCSDHGVCSPITGECICQEGWQGESCEVIFSTSTILTTTEEERQLTTPKATTKTSVSSSTSFPLLTTPKNILTTASTGTTSTTSTRTTSTTTFRPMQPDTKAKPNINTKKPVEFKAINNETAVNNKIAQTDKKLFISITKKPVFANKTAETTTMPAKSTVETTVHFKPDLIITTSTTTKKSTTAKVELTKNVATEFPVTKISPNVRETINKTVPKLEPTIKPDTTLRYPTTLKFKPKEIWIRPAQKGESPILEAKLKTNNNLTPIKHKNATIIELIPITTPKTIMVSIIPTSVSYASFKKIALTTALYAIPNNSGMTKSNNKAADEFTQSMLAQTVTLAPLSKPIFKNESKNAKLATTSTFLGTKSTPHTTSATTRKASTTKLIIVNNSTNSMPRTYAVTPKAPSNSLTTETFSFTNVTFNSSSDRVTENTTVQSISTPSVKKKYPLTTTVRPFKPTTSKIVEITKGNETIMIKSNNTITVQLGSIPQPKILTNATKNIVKNVSEPNMITTTYKPLEDEEKFHILTEPEHITAVMTDKETEGSSVDLVSVISIAGGVMMAVITVAVIIVMMERCRRPRYEDVRKMNDIRMQVMIDNNDVPPPYVRSIFHTPLPDPPTSEKCHYQPISTLDRNLKQFMRPVVVQTISPIMLENFRGILECHYDHLPAVPRRSHDFATLPTRRMAAPSMEIHEQHLLQRASLTNSAIESMKCEAKLDVIDTTTSEPLYAEIPCWRPPSEHAIEIINVNGEAVTEL
ncbi:hypothetical protein ACJJTC_009331 [Scirpophaga incertulas]